MVVWTDFPAQESKAANMYVSRHDSGDLQRDGVDAQEVGHEAYRRHRRRRDQSGCVFQCPMIYREESMKRAMIVPWCLITPVSFFTPLRPAQADAAPPGHHGARGRHRRRRQRGTWTVQLPPSLAYIHAHAHTQVAVAFRPMPFAPFHSHPCLPIDLLLPQEGQIVPGIGDAGERLFNVHYADAHDDAAAAAPSSAPPSAAKKAKSDNGDA